MNCRVCDATGLDLAVDLGLHPWANHFLRKEEIGTEPFYPLRVVFCHQCRTAQLDYTVKKEVMFSDHTYLSGITQSLNDHFRSVAEEADHRFFADRGDKSVLDIGSNDGTQLRHYRALGYDVLGVESSRSIARMANEAGIPTINQFFNLDVARSLRRRFELVNASGVFFHLEELHSVTEGIRHCLAEDGVFVVQFLYMRQIVKNLAFDQIYHEHLLYYNLATIDALLRRHGLYVFDAVLKPIHGGSVIAYVSKKPGRPASARLDEMLATEVRERANELPTYQAFARRIDRLKRLNLDYLAGRKAAGKRIFGLGAPVKGNTLLNHFGIGVETLACLVERNALRQGLYSPGRHIPVLLEQELAAAPDVYYVLAWNFRDEILRRYADLLARGVEFYFPIQPGVI
ncbi:MAG: class I SAM-dependent methyltransferase [Rhodopirellula sp.]|nr:class I SAM-dependent methyltransferase [Rhodopirellula sp.]